MNSVQNRGKIYAKAVVDVSRGAGEMTFLFFGERLKGVSKKLLSLVKQARYMQFFPLKYSKGDFQDFGDV